LLQGFDAQPAMENRHIRDFQGTVSLNEKLLWRKTSERSLVVALHGINDD
jgi:hypothetical protein